MPVSIPSVDLPDSVRRVSSDDLKESPQFQVKAVRNVTDLLPSFYPFMEHSRREHSNPLIKAGGSIKLSKTSADFLVDLVNKLASKTGMVKRHLLPIQAVARKTQQIIAFRPVDHMSTGLIEEGYPTKGFAIKGKSSNHGPQAGLICVDQRLSKLHVTLRDDDDMRQNQITTYNENVQECIKSGDAISVNLTLSQKRFEWLENNGVFSIEKDHKQSGVLKLLSEGLEYRSEKKGEHFEISYEGEPLKVLADPVSGLPLTADYDLMFIAPKVEDLDLATEDNYQSNGYTFLMYPPCIKLGLKNKRVKTLLLNSFLPNRAKPKVALVKL